MSEDFSKMSNDELIKLYHESKAKSVVFNLSQQAKKILLNSCYGAIGNAYFLHNDVRIARAITLAGQTMINKSAKETNEWLNRVIKTKEKQDFRTYSDTDSVAKDSIISINGKEMTIESFWNSLFETQRDSKGKEVFLVDKECFVETSSPDGSKVLRTKVRYAMKHYVCKRMYRVAVDDSYSIKVTEDHSLMYIPKNAKI